MGMIYDELNEVNLNFFARPLNGQFPKAHRNLTRLGSYLHQELPHHEILIVRHGEVTT